MTGLNNLRLWQRLLLSLGLLLLPLLLLGLGLSADRKLADVNAASRVVADNSLPSVAQISEMNAIISDIRVAAWRHVVATDVAQRVGYEKSIDTLTTTLQGQVKAYATLVASPEERALLDRFSDTWRSYTATQNQVLAMSRGNQDEAAAALLHGDSQRRFDQARAELLALVKLKQHQGWQASSRAAAVSVQAHWMLLTLTGAAGLIGVIAAWFLSTSISRPIAPALQAAPIDPGPADLSQGPEERAAPLPESAPTRFNEPLAPPAHQVSAQRVIAQARATAPMASDAPPRPHPPTRPPPPPTAGDGVDGWTSF